MHSSRMHTSHSSCSAGGVCPTPPLMQTPMDADPPSWMQTHPLDADIHPDSDLPVCVTCDACWEATPSPSPWTEGMTHACVNITLPKLLFWTVINDEMVSSKYTHVHNNINYSRSVRATSRWRVCVHCLRCYKHPI